MYIDQLRTLGVFCLCFWLAACATPEDGTPPYMGGPTNFGEANRQTMAAQIIDPTPVYDTLVLESSGDHASQGIVRYRVDRVKRPINPRVSIAPPPEEGTFKERSDDLPKRSDSSPK